MQKIIRFTIVLALFGASVVQAATLKVDVNGMVCAFCAQGIEKKVRALPQTQDVYVDLKQKTVAIEIKDGQSLDEATVKALIKEAGYDVTGTRLVPETAAQLRAQAAKGIQ